jgi:DNA-binding HxlR family transcriptional regulator
MRSYGDGCSSAHALDLIGERWALLIVRDLLFGPKRFTDLRVGLPQGSPNVLSQRLRELEASGIVRRRKLPPPASTMVYELTEWGAQLEPILTGLQRWGAASPSLPQDIPVGCDAAMLALKNVFSSDAAAGFHGVVEVRFGSRDRSCDPRTRRLRCALPRSRGAVGRAPSRGRSPANRAVLHAVPGAGRARVRAVRLLGSMLRQISSGEASRGTIAGLMAREKREPLHTSRRGLRDADFSSWPYSPSPPSASKWRLRARQRCVDPSYEQPLVVPQLEQTKHAPARCMSMPHW